MIKLNSYQTSHRKFQLPYISIGNGSRTKGAVKLIGVMLARFNIVIQQTCHQRHMPLASVTIMALMHIRPLLTLKASKTFAMSIVGSKLDYCNCVVCTVWTAEAPLNCFKHHLNTFTARPIFP